MASGNHPVGVGIEICAVLGNGYHLFVSGNGLVSRGNLEVGIANGNDADGVGVGFSPIADFTTIISTLL